jgi:hypothetical protein
MDDLEVPMFMRHKLDQWETSIETFILNQSEEELVKYADRLRRDSDSPSPETALVSLLALFGLTYVWVRLMNKDEGYSEE